MLAIEREMGMRGITQTALAEKTGYHRVYVNRIIRGREKPYKKFLETVAHTLNWQGDPADLMREVEVI
jgi:transcriptional regulator with XRE-family HTH domain